MSWLDVRRTPARVACPIFVTALLIAAPVHARDSLAGGDASLAAYPPSAHSDASATAYPQSGDRDRDRDRRERGPVSDRARLDDAIRDAHAAADAARDGGDRSLAQRMNAFARKVSEVRERAGERDNADRTRRDLVRLADDSRAIERDISGRRSAPPEAAAAWSHVVRSFDVMTGSTEASGTSGSGREDERATDRDRDRQRDQDEALRGDREGKDRDAGALPAELDRRVRHAESLADEQGVGVANSLIGRFAARSSRLTAEFGTLSVDERQDRAKRLLDEARQVQQSLTRENASPELVEEWNQVIDVLTRMGGAR